LNADARHADLFRHITDVIDVRLPHCGHPSTPYLAELGLLSGSLKALAAGTFDAAQLQHEARRRRKEAAQYYVNLAQRARSPRLKADLGARAIALAPDSAETRAHYAVLAAGAGRWEEALAAMDVAEAREPHRHFIKLQRSRVHELLGDIAAAAKVMELLAAQAPEVREYRARLRYLRAKQLMAGLRKRLPQIG
jgi:hypothetical protein